MGAAKGVAVGVAEVVVATLGIVGLDAAVQDASESYPFGGLVVGVIVLSLVAGAVIGAGLVASVLLKIHRWWQVVLIANIACFLLFAVSESTVVRVAITLAVFAAVGALASALEGGE